MTTTQTTKATVTYGRFAGGRGAYTQVTFADGRTVRLMGRNPKRLSIASAARVGAEKHAPSCAFFHTAGDCSCGMA